jgi:glycerophosphoryl diester phosphodiesterase
LAAARIVAHRGLYDNRRCLENTLPAFDAALAAGVWGLECDIRWTRDGVAVVHHDPDGRRLFGFHRPIAALTRRELKRACPSIPTLETVVARYGRRVHLMLEIKAAPGRQTDAAERALAASLAGLTPVADYHLMSLDPELLAGIRTLPRKACLPIARLNTRALARMATAEGYGGLTGHYTLMSRRLIDALHRQGRRVGTGFVNSAGSLYREMARGVDWFFSDRALTLQRVVTRRRTGR